MIWSCVKQNLAQTKEIIYGVAPIIRDAAALLISHDKNAKKSVKIRPLASARSSVGKSTRFLIWGPEVRKIRRERIFMSEANPKDESQGRDE